MSDERGVNPALAVKLLLKRKDDKCFADVLAQQLDSSLPPSPELRADIIDNRNSTLVQLASDAPIKRRSIDDDPKIGLTTISLGDQMIEKREIFRR